MDRRAGRKSGADARSGMCRSSSVRDRKADPEGHRSGPGSLLSVTFRAAGSPKSSARSTYVQVVPIYLKSDVEVARYFTECRDEIDAISGENLVILLAQEIRASDTAGVVAALTKDGTKPSRFAGLGFGDLPCLWVEDGLGRTAILKLPHEFADISQVLRTLSDVCAQTKDAPQIEALVSQRLKANASARSPWLAVLLGGFPLSKMWERLIAVGFGVVFVTAVLVIAMFIPSPTAFQYTIFRIVLALAAAGFVSMTPGFIEAKIGTVIRAGGALAVFVIVFFYSPAALQALH